MKRIKSAVALGAALVACQASAQSAVQVYGLTYPLSKRTAIYASIGHLDNDGNSAVALDLGGTAGAGLTQNGVMTGIRHAF